MPESVVTCHCRSEHAFAAAVVVRALERSFGKAQVLDVPQVLQATPGTIAVYICPEAEALPNMDRLLRQGGKVLVFGRPGAAVLARLGLTFEEPGRPWSGLDAAELCFTESFHASSGLVVYGNHPLAKASPLRCRPFRRYDYAEWNNLGYGAIATDDGPFAAVPGFRADDDQELAGLTVAGEDESLGSYLAVKEEKRGALLWCARPVGPVDSLEWQVVERFICDWRPDLCCLPCLLQTPRGCSCLVTMRLDCDEAIASARPVFEWYRDKGLPLSLAVKTGLDMTAADIALLEEVRGAGGTLLSHSRTHPQSWGEDAAQATEEARLSREWFARQWPAETPTDLAVSPFHTNPPYAMQALAKAGYTGVVGGIINNDLEYCLGRAGVVPFADGLVSISQQSMLHGDSYRNQGHTVDVHVEAFRAQRAARGIFGYLDHPFSQRYHYGWDSEDQRLGAHAALLAAMDAPGVWVRSQRECFDFVKALAAASPRLETGKVVGESSPFELEYRLRGDVRPLGG